MKIIVNKSFAVVTENFSGSWSIVGDYIHDTRKGALDEMKEMIRVGATYEGADDLSVQLMSAVIESAMADE